MTLPLQHSLVPNEPLGDWAEGEELGRAQHPRGGSGTGGLAVLQVKKLSLGKARSVAGSGWERGSVFVSRAGETRFAGASAPQLLSPP